MRDVRVWLHGVHAASPRNPVHIAADVLVNEAWDDYLDRGNHSAGWLSLAVIIGVSRPQRISMAGIEN
jgi:hypothetical protein